MRLEGTPTVEHNLSSLEEGSTILTNSGKWHVVTHTGTILGGKRAFVILDLSGETPPRTPPLWHTELDLQVIFEAQGGIKGIYSPRGKG